MHKTFRFVGLKVVQTFDRILQELMRYECREFGNKPRHNQNTKPAFADDEIKKLIISAKQLDDIWQFLVKRLCNGTEPKFLAFSFVDDAAEILRLRYLTPTVEGKTFQGEFIPLCDKESHLVKTVLRADTTFTSRLSDLGQEVIPYLTTETMEETEEKHNIFSIPLIAGNRPIAVITLGFHELDNFTQAKLSYVYSIRNQLAHTVWNLILLERINAQPQLDPLTNLMTQGSLIRELRKMGRQARFEQTPLSLLLIDIHQLAQYNQQYSYQMGDRAIARLVTIAKELTRGIDIVARYGSDEIAVLIPGADSEAAFKIAHKLVSEIQQTHRTIKPFRVSISLANFPKDTQNPEELVQITENAMQFGKHQHSSHKGEQSLIFCLSDVEKASERQKIAVFASRLIKKYESGCSELYEALINRIDKGVPLTKDKTELEVVVTLFTALESKVPYVYEHAKAVAGYAVAMATMLGLPPAEIEKIRLAALLHDIGHVATPEHILKKNRSLTNGEWGFIHQHPTIAARQLLSSIPQVYDVLSLIEYHHERWDGQGYPMGLKGENVPIGARIIGLADAFQAMTSDRPWRKACSIDEAKALIQDGAGQHWDPELVAILFELIETAQVHIEMPGRAVLAEQPSTGLH